MFIVVGSHNHHLYQDVEKCRFYVCALFGDWQILCFPEECANNQVLCIISTFFTSSSLFVLESVFKSTRIYDRGSRFAANPPMVWSQNLRFAAFCLLLARSANQKIRKIFEPTF